MTYIRLLWVFFRVGILSELAYRVNFVVATVPVPLGIAHGVGRAGCDLCLHRSPGRLAPDELVALVGVYFLVGERSVWSSSPAWSG